MINKIIDEISSALEHNLYLSALSLSLVLIDSCSKAEYPTEKNNGNRFKNWYKTYIGDRIFDTNGLPNINEEVAYSLRCCLLHEGNPNVKSRFGIDKFELIFQEKDSSPDIIEVDDYTTIINCKYLDMYGIDSNTGDRLYRLNVRSYCEWICKCVSEYNQTNNAKFSFNYTIVDWEDIKP